jgi:hypothetical protein
VTIGVITAVDALTVAVDWPGNPNGEPVPALAATVLDRESVGRKAALLFAGGDPASPFVIGLVRDPEAIPNASLDGERVLLEAAREIVLRCGRASITLTRAGKIVVRGAYISSRSSGVHRIKGASVQIN